MKKIYEQKRQGRKKQSESNFVCIKNDEVMKWNIPLKYGGLEFRVY